MPIKLFAPKAARGYSDIEFARLLEVSTHVLDKTDLVTDL